MNIKEKTTEELEALALEIAAELDLRKAATNLTPIQIAELVFLERREGNQEAISVRGAQNDYNSKGRGSTMARRVLRNNKWIWLSEPASRGRTLSADRNDTKYGDVYEGELVAEYTLGSSRPTPEKFFIAAKEEKPLKLLDFAKLKTGYRITLPSGQTAVVDDPSWK